MDTANISLLIEREIDLKGQLKELRLDIKGEIEETKTYKSFLEHSLAVPDGTITEKTAKAHAFKVTYELLSPKEAEDEESPEPKAKSKKNKGAK
jgi:regulator of RNase E activity RraB